MQQLVHALTYRIALLAHVAREIGALKREAQVDTDHRAILRQLSAAASEALASPVQVPAGENDDPVRHERVKP